MRPQSIVIFERLYLASVALGLLFTAQNWSAREALLARNPTAAQFGWIGPATTAVGLLIALALWYFVARRGSVVAKWIVTVFAVWAAVLLALYLFGLAAIDGRLVTILTGAAQNLLYVASAVMLHRADSRAWFGENLRLDDIDAPVEDRRGDMI